MDTGKRIAQLVQEACIREVCVPKPGNVTRDHDFRDTTFEDFLLSALAIGPAFEDAAHATVGQIVLRATEDCRRRVRSNTNLGIVLLLAPAAKAGIEISGSTRTGQPPDSEAVREHLHSILQFLSVEDARLVYEAIRLAGPAGLGETPVQDIAEEPTVTLLEAMSLAKERDSIASEYVTDFEITFSVGLPALKEAQNRGMSFSDAVVHAYLTILSRIPDTLIARKNGLEASRKVSELAGEVLFHGGVYSPQGREMLLELDHFLRNDAHSLNPGTTADLTAAVIFFVLLEMSQS